MSPLTWFLLIAGLFAVVLVVQARKAGPRQLPPGELTNATLVRGATMDEPGAGWTKLGSATQADGLRLRFDHDDDPQAEAAFVVEERAVVNTLANRQTVRLTNTFEDHHVHTRGCVFRVRLRGTGAVVGKEIKILMQTHGDGSPAWGQVENDDSLDAAVGDWIEFERVEVLRLPVTRS